MIRISIILFLFLCLPFAVSAQTYRQLSEKAVECIEKDSLRQAEELLLQALKLEPKNAKNALLFSNLGLVQRRLGEYDKADYKLAQNGPAAKQIHMLGPHKDAVYYLPGKDVCICPSTRDASPRSLREAMACKVACIVTDIPGARDLVVDGRTGIIVQAGSPQAIAEGIRVLAADRAKTKMMGEAGYQRIRTDYTMEEYVRRLKGVFDAIMTK